ncbi:MAG: patatin-like phospholipase family protein [Gemmatimonadota bacterium]|nr:patatin-like phospholipase family protein [Gemmatimonadota bacterium]
MILTGGGPASSAWELGIIAGMAEVGLDVRTADLLVGTSSGSRVALHLASAVPHDVAVQQRLRPGPPSTERPAALDWVRLREDLATARESGGSAAEILRRVGALALAAAAGKSGASRRQIVAPQLPMATWPERRVLIPTVSAESGERRVFDRDSGIDVVDAVIATTASFGMPPMLFQGEHYFDGGYYSSDNADLAIGFDRVLILSLIRPPGVPFVPVVAREESVARLRDSGSSVEVILPDDNTAAAFAAAGGAMNPSISATAATAGRVQGVGMVNENLLSFWQ